MQPLALSLTAGGRTFDLTPRGPLRLSPAAFECTMGLLAAAWPTKPLPKATLTVYRLILGHLRDDVALQAAQRALLTRRFFPEPSELLEDAHAVLADLGEGPPPADLAWSSVLEACRRDSTADLDPLTAEALRLTGGLRVIAQTHWESLPHWERRFCRIYSTLVQRHHLEAAGLAALPPAPATSSPFRTERTTHQP